MKHSTNPISPQQLSALPFSADTEVLERPEYGSQEEGTTGPRTLSNLNRRETRQQQQRKLGALWSLVVEARLQQSLLEGGPEGCVSREIGCLLNEY